MPPSEIDGAEKVKNAAMFSLGHKDFGELAILHKRPHNGILRLVNIAARNQGPVCLRVLNLYHKELQAGAIITVRDDRVRIRPPDMDDSE